MSKPKGQAQPEYSGSPWSDVGAPAPKPHGIPVEHRLEDSCLLAARQAARRLGISVTSLYSWLGLSDRGLLVIRGQAVTVNYFQGGPKGQGRIRIEPGEIERLKEFMRVHPQPCYQRRPAVRRADFPGITVPLGRPA